MAVLPSIVPAAARTHASQRLANFAKRDFLRKEYTIPHVQKLAEDAVIAREEDLAERILAFGNDHVKDGLRPDWAEFEYRTRAAIAFARKDRAAFESLVIPDSESDRERAHRIASATKFYNALFLLDSDPDAAAKILARQDPQSSDVVATSLLAARLGAAAKVAAGHEQRAAYQRALEEWQRNAVALLASPPSLRVTAQLNVLLALDGARHDDAFDIAWAGMPDEMRSQPQFLGVFVANAQRRGAPAAANSAIETAIAYHRDSKGTPAWLADLQAQIASATLIATPAALASAVRPRPSIPEWRSSYLEMLQLPASFLVCVVSDTIPLQPVSETELLGEYLLWQHIEAARTLTDRIETIRQISNENKYNDIFVSLLHARLAFLGWHVADQARGGQSGTGSREASSAGVGERDWVIRDRSGGQLAVTEAYRLGSVEEAVIDKHLSKLRGYNPIGTSPTFVVVYVETSQFIAFAERYQRFVNSYSLPDSTSCVVEEHHCVLQPSPGAAIKTLKATYTTSRGRATVFHVLVHMGER